MKFHRHFTSSSLPIEQQIKWKICESKITKSNGTVIFHMENIEVPDHWSQQATNILAQKYFRKAGVPSETIESMTNFDISIPAWLHPRGPHSATNRNVTFGSETSAKQVFHRLSGTWTYWGWKEGIFKEGDPLTAGSYQLAKQNARIFYDEIYFMLAHQFAAPNSPQFFNTGLFWAYGIMGDPNGQWANDKDGNVFETQNQYEYSQPHACFIQPISDNLIEEGGIFDLLKKEARLFKHGSGTGTNFSNLRGKGEKLGGGGVSSGLMSFLKVFDVAAGSISSGGVTRRAAKMICLDLDHPEIEEFIDWKMNEEAKAASLYVGSLVINNEAGYRRNGEMREDTIPETIYDRLDNNISIPICDKNFEGEAINTVSAQNANNSIRITDGFFEAVNQDSDWWLISRSKDEVVKTLKAKQLWEKIIRAAWACGDPGLQFHNTINEWHTCKTDGNINASNPCCFVGETLIQTFNGPISIKTLRDMYEEEKPLPPVISWQNGQTVYSNIKQAWIAGTTTDLIEVFTTVGSFTCTPEHRWMLVKSESWEWVEAKQLKFGMKLQISHEEMDFASVISIREIQSNEIIQVYNLEIENTNCFAVVSKDFNIPIIVHNSEYMFLDNTACNLASLNLGKFLKGSEFQIKDFEHATRLWAIVLEISVYMASFPSKEIAENSYAYRTLGLGYMNLGGILMRLGLGYDSDQGRNIAAGITAILHGQSYLTSQEMANELGPFSHWENNKDCMANVISMHRQYISRINCTGLAGKLVVEATKIWNEIINDKPFRNAQVTLLAPTGTIHLVTDCDTSGIEPDFSLIKYKNLSGGGNIQIVNECVPEALKNLGYTHAQIFTMIQHIHDYGNLEEFMINGSHLPEEHLCVFNCANPSGIGTRYLRPMAHILMMAAVQPFLSGAISKTCNLPNSATIQDVDFIYREAHRLNLKAIAIYRDGSKLTQPLSSKKEIKKEIYSEKEKYFLDRAFITHPPIITNGSIQDLPQSSRKQLPSRRRGYRQKVKIDGQSVYLSTGEYENGKLGEIWIEISREGSTVRALLGGFSKAISLALQYGVPLQEFVDAFVYTKFEPAGIVEGHDKIKLTTSVLDFIFRELAIQYLDQREFSNVNQEDESLDFKILSPPPPVSPSPSPPPIPYEIFPTKTPSLTKSINFTGNACPNCGHTTLRQIGTCVECTTCFSNTGCG